MPSAAAQYTTIVAWAETPCIEVDIPDHYRGTLHQNLCHQPGEVALLSHTAAPGQSIGADPIMGAASSIACSVMRDYDKAILV